jgi:hypothetical protein
MNLSGYCVGDFRLEFVERKAGWGGVGKAPPHTGSTSNQDRYPLR